MTISREITATLVIISAALVAPPAGAADELAANHTLTTAAVALRLESKALILAGKL